jgi:hypothetical protein
MLSVRSLESGEIREVGIEIFVERSVEASKRSDSPGDHPEA